MSSGLRVDVKATSTVTDTTDNLTLILFSNMGKLEVVHV